MTDGTTFDAPCETEARDVLKRHFGHATFRAGQWQTIAAVMGGRDALFVAATGTGKSLVYQFGAVFRSDRAVGGREDVSLPPAPGSVTLVLSPLLALQKDQVAAFARRRVRVCCLNSEQQDPVIWAAAARGGYHLIYSTPETTLGRLLPAVKRLAADGLLGCIAVDEAHVVSEWGSDFRLDYRRLSELRRLLPGVPMLACTATATPTVRDDIVASLGMRSPLLVVSSFNRPNLHYAVRSKSGKVQQDLAVALGPVFGADDQGGCAIVFVPTQRETISVADVLNCTPFAAAKRAARFAAPYHAGLPPDEKEAVHRAFASGELRVVVATIAFGMGIDKPDVRAVVNYGTPKNLESFYQQTGRAGRDGKPARCVMFWSAGDFATAQHLANSGSPPVAGKYNPLDGLRALRTFVMTQRCRRRQLLEYFGDAGTQDDVCQGCDVCDATRGAGSPGGAGTSSVEVADFTDDARIFLEAVRFVGDRGGLSTLRGVIRGSSSTDISKRFGKAALQACPAYGRGASKSETFWDKFPQIALTLGFVNMTNVSIGARGPGKSFSYAAYKLTPAGSRFAADLAMRLPPMVVPEGMRVSTRAAGAGTDSKSLRGGLAPNEVPLSGEQERIFAALREARLEAAAGRPAYVVAYDRVLRAIARARPATLEDLRAVEGVSSNLARLHGARFLAVVAKCDLGAGLPRERTASAGSAAKRGAETPAEEGLAKQQRML
jgi:RecQ family ATP-dependent DNA helicase